MLTRLIQRFPVLVASGAYTLVVAVAFWPFWVGRSLLTGWPISDQLHVYPFRQFAMDFLREHGDFAPWNPYIMGGMPFAANVTNGDTFYPVSLLLRFLLPVDAGITLGFLVHIVLAGVFTFLFLRALKLEWGPAFVGGAAYMFTGQLVSLVTAGHDGKLAVSALLPLALLCLYRGISRGDWRWYLGFGGVLGLSLLSPHVQMTYYLLMAAGFFWLFMVRWSGERLPSHSWLTSGLLFVVGLSVGFALSGIQSLPFVEYIGYSPRGGEAAAAGATSTGWEYATSYAMPPEELLNVVWPSFSGMVDQYWGRNFLKYHSEYLGVAPLMLACFGFGVAEKRRMAWFLVFLIIYGVLFALGGATPFYRLPYHLLPGIKMTRGAGMIFFLVAFGVACLAAFGTQALARAAGNVRRAVFMWWLGGLAVAVVLALGGAFKGVMVSLAPPDRLARVDPNYIIFTWDTFRALGIALGVVGLWWALSKGRLIGEWWALALGGLVLLDLFSVEQRQVRFGPPAHQEFAADAVVQAIANDADLYRVLPLRGYATDNYPMAHGLRSVLGYQGTELHRYDELLGGKNLWRNLGSPNLWGLLAVKYVVVDRPIDFAALRMVGEGPLTTYQGESVYLYQYTEAQPFARVVAEALRVPDEQTIPTLLDARFDPARLLLVGPDAPAGATSLAALPDLVPNQVATTQVRPGHYRFDLASPAERAAYLFVSENYYPAWRATVDGAAATVLRAQYALMAVPLPAGARSVELIYRSRTYAMGRLISIATLFLIVALVGVDRIRRGREGSGG